LRTGDLFKLLAFLVQARFFIATAFRQEGGLGTWDQDGLPVGVACTTGGEHLEFSQPGFTRPSAFSSNACISAVSRR
jgi:hypothetical protein